ncbi:hypothetical protein KJ918_00520 [Patescibacteria group bacterium]|nr:hypothetical protein [Patescibacteria group bacterium]
MNLRRSITGNKILSFGGLFGIGLSILLITILAEHIFTFWLLSWTVPIAVIIGAEAQQRKLLPSPKFVVSLVIFTLLILLSVSFSKGRNYYLENKREKILISTAPIHESSTIIKKSYYRGDGFDNESQTSITMKTEEEFSSIVEFYKTELENQGWRNVWPIKNNSGLWEKDNLGIGIKALDPDDDKTKYVVYMKFWGNWFNDMFYQL